MRWILLALCTYAFLQLQCDRLAQLQRRIRFPKPKTFTVGEECYKLPLKAVEAVRAPSREELEYMVGFFDGDGCVSMAKTTGELCLSVGQSMDSAEVLLMFRSLLGGSVLGSKEATGSRKAALRWIVCSSKMKRAATLLGGVPSTKRAQLQIAARGSVPKQMRVMVGEELRLLKRKDHVPHTLTKCSWPYMSGFFDAEGSITVPSGWCGLRVELGQAKPYVLERLHAFLHGNNLKGWVLYLPQRPRSDLVCTKLEDCKQTLELLLAHGLHVKRKQAELALNLTAQNHLQTREAIISLNGFNGRYQRLDKEGVSRAREICRLRKKMQPLSGEELASMQQILEYRRAEHALQKLISRYFLLQRDTRLALRQSLRLHC